MKQLLFESVKPSVTQIAACFQAWYKHARQTFAEVMMKSVKTYALFIVQNLMKCFCLQTQKLDGNVTEQFSGLEEIDDKIRNRLIDYKSGRI